MHDVFPEELPDMLVAQFHRADDDRYTAIPIPCTILLYHRVSQS